MIHQSILDRGVTLLAIAPSRPEFSRQLTKKLNLSIPILTDQDNTLASKFGLVFTLPEELREVYLAFGIDRKDWRIWPFDLYEYSKFDYRLAIK